MAFVLKLPHDRSFQGKAVVGAGRDNLGSDVGKREWVIELRREVFEVAAVERLAIDVGVDVEVIGLEEVWI